MKYLLSLLLLSFAFTSCEKAVENKQKDLLVNLITNGRWVVANYTKGGTDVTADFNGYQFQFKENRTVDAIKNNAVEKSGTWDGNAVNRTIVSGFPGASMPLTLLTGTFYITDSTPTSVDATQTVNGEARTLRLTKL